MIQQTVEEQARALFWHRKRQDNKPRHLLNESDQLLYWLEECMAQNLKLTPGWLLPRIAHVLSNTDRELSERLGRDRRPEQVMEVLFAAQEVLMAELVRTHGQPARVIQLFRR